MRTEKKKGRGLKAVMMDSLISWKQTGAESFPPKHLLFWTATGSAGQDDQ